MKASSPATAAQQRAKGTPTRVTDAQIEGWGRHFGLSAATVAQLKFMNASDPVREGAGRIAVTGIYPSAIMGVGLRWEGTAEAAFVTKAHVSRKHRPLIILDQPCLVPVDYIDKEGVRRVYNYPPDWAVLTEAGEAKFCECKHEDDLLASQDPEKPRQYRPGLFERDENGRWFSPPLEQAAARLGMGFEVWALKRSDARLVNNLEFLAEYADDRAVLNESAAAKLRGLVEKQPGIQVRDLALLLEDGEIDSLYLMILWGSLYCDLAKEMLDPNFTARIYPSDWVAELAVVVESQPASTGPTVVEVRPGLELEADGKAMRVTAVSDKELTISGHDGAFDLSVEEFNKRLQNSRIKACVNALTARSLVHEFWKVVPAEEWEVIHQRFKHIEPFLLEEAIPHERTDFRWQAAFRKEGLLGLRIKKRTGNRKSKLDPRARKIMEDTVEEIYRTPDGPNIEAVAAEIRLRCKESVPELRPVSRKSVGKYIASLDDLETIRRREGPGRAYSKEPPVWTDEWDEICKEGQHPWGVFHIDHTQANVEAIEGNRPWRTTLFSPRYGRIMAEIVRFERPNYVACMLVIRECIRRHGRISQFVVTDGGKEFRGHYFTCLLGFLGVVQKFRPPRKARFGAKLERTFRTQDTRLLHNMTGNTRLMTNPRSLSPGFRAKDRASYSLMELQWSFRDHSYLVHDGMADAATGLSPQQAFQNGMRLGGPRVHKFIIYNRDFELMTMPTTKSGTATVTRHDGVRINRIRYWCAEFRSAEYDHKKFPVKFDPEDIRRAFVQLNGQWVECHCRDWQHKLNGLSGDEVAATSAVVLNRLRQSEKTRDENSERSARGLRRVRKLKDEPHSPSPAAPNPPPPISADSQPLLAAVVALANTSRPTPKNGVVSITRKAGS